jgi:hypothetical protein
VAPWTQPVVVDALIGRSAGHGVAGAISGAVSRTPSVSVASPIGAPAHAAQIASSHPVRLIVTS